MKRTPSAIDAGGVRLLNGDIHALRRPDVFIPGANLC